MLKKLPFLFLLFAANQLFAHPAPELAVRTHFDSAMRTLTIRFEADPRVLFDGNPEEVPFLKPFVVDAMSDEEKEAEIAKVEAYALEAVALYLSSEQRLEPKFEWSYGVFGDSDEAVTPDSDLVIHGEWTVTVPETATGFYIAPREGLPVSVRYENFLNGEKLERYQVLFGGETSYVFKFEVSD